MALQSRSFNGKTTKDDRTVEYTFSRIIYPWSKTGKDSEGRDVDGAVPTLSEVLHYLTTRNFPTEIQLENGKPTGSTSVVQFLVDGVNLHDRTSAMSEATNTEESTFDDAVRMMMRKRNMTREQAMLRFAELATQ